MTARKNDSGDPDENVAAIGKGVCGIVMPISSIDGYPASHWRDVLEILIDVAKGAGLNGKLVSHSNYVGVIQKRIINNLYHNEIVVCDVSGKNANVMFELGMRLAFDKPTIIIKDDKTEYIFDTSGIEHLSYPSDLRYGAILEFKDELAQKILSTKQRFENDPNTSTFLKEYGEFEVAKLATKNVSGEELQISELREELAQAILLFKNSQEFKASTVATNTKRSYAVEGSYYNAMLEVAPDLLREHWGSPPYSPIAIKGIKPQLRSALRSRFQFFSSSSFDSAFEAFLEVHSI